jgi:hypothetical protein
MAGKLLKSGYDFALAIPVSSCDCADVSVSPCNQKRNVLPHHDGLYVD